ncbi:MAG: ABC transporter substrate-binding protein [Anaerovibrio sp.]|uniref:ABC transporter substrate-binding protein n=1 Tax=Anaerovibrio sp. TaxID=1872532 RepID=UPI0025E5DEE1|nr:ABC transporter substrate-binding protein [Anaerovibrio sp.]MCR5175671.1 ABC transporter substrate-binding protein [Anaerovibrio sp.]
MGRKLGLILSVVCVALAVVFIIFGDTIAGRGNATSVNSITLTDSTGKEVTITKNPKRVVILNASNVDLFVAAGGGDSIVGRTQSNALSGEVLAATANAEDVGMIHAPNIEKIIALKPDLVIGTNVPFHLALAPTLEKAGIPLFINSVDKYDQIEGSLTKFGQITGQEEKADKEIAKIKADYAEIIRSVEGKKPLKSLVIFGNTQSFNMATSQTFTGDLINRLGGNNIADNVKSGEGAYIPLSMEFLAKENPEVIMLIMMGKPQEVQEKVRADLEANPVWGNTSAVKNGRVYTLPYNLFTVNPGVQCIDALQVLAGYVY